MNTMNYYIFLIFGLAAMLQSCSQDDELSAYTKDNGELTIIATTDGFTSTDNVQTRASDNGYATSFSNGDKIGIIATLNGSVVVNNIACTYNDGQWTGDVLHKNGATYFAYYPYRESMNDKKDVEEVVNAFNVSSDQSSHKLYTENDLMTATGNIAGTGKKTLTLNFTHALSLVEFKFTPNQTGYRYYEPSQLSIKIGSSDVSPYFVDGVYRCLVKPGNSIQVSGRFYAAGVEKNFNKTYTSTKGTYKKMNVSYTITHTLTRAIAIGDYYCADGSIHQGNNPPNNCIGIIYCVDANFLKNNGTKTSYFNGLVVALKDANSSKCNWSTAKSSAENYSVQTPAASSGWYFPNADEMQYMSMGTTFPTKSDQGLKVLIEKFKVLGNTASALNRDGDGYWTSTKADNSNSWRVVYQYDGDKFWNADSDNRHSRSSLAF